MSAPMCRLLGFLLIAAGLAGCAGIPQPGTDPAAALQTAQQQFAAGRYRESLEGCRAVIAGGPGCAWLDRALYGAALNSMQLHPGDAGRAEAAAYFRRLATDCPDSPYRSEAGLWLAALEESAGRGSAPPPDILKKKDQEIKRLRAEVQRLNREIDLLKNVDVQMHRQKKDLDDGPDERKNSRP